MKLFLQIQKKVIPDMLKTMEKRFLILRTISHLQPVGRRTLATKLQMTERILRSEVEFLKEQNLLVFNPAGMPLSIEGEHTFKQLAEVMKRLTGVAEIEQDLKNKYLLQDVIIVPGNSDESPFVKGELGVTTAERLITLLKKDAVIAVTGGSTMAAMAENLPHASQFSYESNLIFAPARGGVGSDTQNQANTICEKMAEKTGSSFRTLYLPEQLSETSYQTLLNEPTIKDTVNLLKKANIVVHGVGEAMVMAEKRKASETEKRFLLTKKAVGEVFGQYYNEDGEIVHRIQTIGIRMDDLKNIENVIAVAGGTSKTKAIKAFIKIAPVKLTLITDEAVALELLKD